MSAAVVPPPKKTSCAHAKKEARVSGEFYQNLCRAAAHTRMTLRRPCGSTVSGGDIVEDRRGREREAKVSDRQSLQRADDLVLQPSYELLAHPPPAGSARFVLRKQRGCAKRAMAERAAQRRRRRAQQRRASEGRTSAERASGARRWNIL